MGAMYRLKAYFGMVPAEEMDDYSDEPVADRYASPRRGEGRGDDRHGDDRWDDRSYDDERSADRYDDDWDRRPAREAPRTAGLDRVRDLPAREPVRAAAGPSPSGISGIGPSAVRGALAVDPDAMLHEPSRLPDRPPPTAVPEQRVRAAAALSRITTLQPRSYNEARTIGERYRDGVPVIMNLTELDDAAAKRLVDFAAGLAFALRGSIDKVTSRVFLLTPADVEVSADDARRLAERGLFRSE